VDAILTSSCWLALATNGSIEEAYRALVQVFRLAGIDLRALPSAPEHDAPDWVLAHHIGGRE
jgi:hypothetical protein